MTTFRMSWRILLAALLLLTGAVAAQDAAADSPAVVTTAGTPEALCEAAGTPAAPEVNTWGSPDMVLEDGVDYRAIFCTTAGPVYLDLYENVTPLTVNSLVFLAYNGFYNGTIFHRVIEDFMAQGGDPLGTGTGGPGYQFQDEFEPYLFFDRTGLLAMANSGPSTNGSQFFITTSLTPHLDYQHTIYGEVLEGYENVESILLRDPSAGGDATTLNTVLIVKDPSLVETTFVEPEAPTQADLEAALSTENVLNAVSALWTGFPADMVTVTTESLTAEEAVEAAPNSIKRALGDLLTGTGVEYVVSGTMSANNCALEIGPGVTISSFSYTVYTLESAAAALAALEDSNLVTLGIAGGLTKVDGLVFDSPLYTGETTACDQPALGGRTFLTRGRYLIEVETSVLANSEAPLSLLIPGFSTVIFDRALADVIRAGLR